MDNIEKIIESNKKFVANKEYELFKSTKYPKKKIAILSCMDTRLTELLPAALNLKNGDFKMIKNAGAVITHPFGSVMRSLILAVYELKVEDVLVIGHYDCGMQGLDADKLIEKIVSRGIPKETVEMVRYCGIDYYNWLKGFENAEVSVCETVDMIMKHPLMPKDIHVYGFMINPETGELSLVRHGAACVCADYRDV